MAPVCPHYLTSNERRADAANAEDRGKVEVVDSRGSRQGDVLIVPFELTIDRPVALRDLAPSDAGHLPAATARLSTQSKVAAAPFD